MELHDAVSRPCYSMRLFRPFLKVVRRAGVHPDGAFEAFEAWDTDARIPIDMAHRLLEDAIARTGNAYLGLDAARELALGELGALEYAATSARTLRDALGVLGRYARLLRDGLDYSIESHGGRARLCFESSIALPPAAEDYQLAAFHSAVLPRYETPPSDFEVCFKHEAPAELAPYQAIFGSAQLRFGQSFSGFVGDASNLDLPLRSADPQLHEVLRTHAEQLLRELPRAEIFTERVREVLLHELRSGEPTAARVASALAVSSRTLARRLEAEGSSLRVILDDLRRALAERYATTTDLQMAEIALLLGFSNAAAFNRAFKRWTQMTPAEYRRAHRR